MVAVYNGGGKRGTRMADVTVVLNEADVEALTECEALSMGLRQKIASAAGDAFDLAAPKLACKRCGFARVTSRTAVAHLAMHVRADEGTDDVDVTPAMVADGFTAAQEG